MRFACCPLSNTGREPARNATARARPVRSAASRTITLTSSLFNFSHLGVGACDSLQPAGKIAKRVGGYWDPDRFPIGRVGKPAKLPRDQSKAILPVHG